MKTEPQTIPDIKQTIEECKTRQQLEQLTIDALENKLKHIESEKIKDAMIKTAKGKIIKHALKHA